MLKISLKLHIVSGKIVLRTIWGPWNSNLTVSGWQDEVSISQSSEHSNFPTDLRGAKKSIRHNIVVHDTHLNALIISYTV